MKRYENYSIALVGMILMSLFGIVMSVYVIGSDIKGGSPPDRLLAIIDTNSVENDTTHYLIPKKTDYAKSERNGEITPAPIKLFSDADLLLNRHPKFAIWIISFAILICFSFGFIIPVLGLIHKLQNVFKFSGGIIGLSLALAIIFVGLASIFSIGLELRLFCKGDLIFSYAQALENFSILLSHPSRTIQILIGLASIGPILAIAGLFLIIGSFDKFRKYLELDLSISKNRTGFYKQFKLLSELSNRFLLVLAITISGTVITTSFLRGAIIESISLEISKLFPVEFIYLYGLAYTIFIVIAYAPVYFQLKNIGYEALENKNFMESEVRGEAEMYQKAFSLKGSSVNTLQIIISLLSPALTGIVSNFLV